MWHIGLTGATPLRGRLAAGAAANAAAGGMVRLAAAAACLLAVVRASVCRHRVEIETWTQLPHSYSIVGLALAKELSAAMGNECVHVVEAPAYRGRQAQWSRRPSADNASTALGRSGGERRECPDVILRAAFPLRLRKRGACPAASVVVLGTTEFGVAPIELFQDAEAEAAAGALAGCALDMAGPCTLRVAWSKVGPGVGVAAPSHWAAAGFAQAGLRADQLLVLPHGVDPSLWSAPMDAARAAGAAVWPAPAAFIRARQWQSMLGRFAAAIDPSGAAAAPLGSAASLDPACVWVVSVGSGTMNKGLDTLLEAAAGAALRVAPLGGCVRLLLKGLDAMYESDRLLQQWVGGAGRAMARAMAARTIAGSSADGSGGDQAAGASLRVWSVGSELSQGAVAALVAGADLYAAPFRGEGFALPVLEAAAAGAPVVATAGGAADDYMSESWAVRVPSRPVAVSFGGQLGGGLAPDPAALSNAVVWAGLAKAAAAGRLGTECAAAVAAAAAAAVGPEGEGARVAQPEWLTMPPGRASCRQVATAAAWLSSASLAGRASAREWSWERAAAELLAAIDGGTFPPERRGAASCATHHVTANAPATTGAVWRGRGAAAVRAVMARTGDAVSVTLRLCGVSDASSVMLAIVGATPHAPRAGRGRDRVGTGPVSPSEARATEARAARLLQRQIVGRWRVGSVWSGAQERERAGSGCVDAEVSWTARLGHMAALTLGPEAPGSARLCEVREDERAPECGGSDGGPLRELWFAVAVEGSASLPAHAGADASLGEAASAWLGVPHDTRWSASPFNLSRALGRFGGLLAAEARAESPKLRALGVGAPVADARRPHWAAIGEATTSLWLGGDEAGAVALGAQPVRARAASRASGPLSPRPSALRDSAALGGSWECGWVAPVPQPREECGESRARLLLEHCSGNASGLAATGAESQLRSPPQHAAARSAAPVPWTGPGGSRLFGPSPYLWYRAGAAAAEAFEAGAHRLAQRVALLLGGQPPPPPPLPPARTIVVVSETLHLHSSGKALARVLASAAARLRDLGWAVKLIARRSDARLAWPANPSELAAPSTAACRDAGVWPGICAAGVTVDVSPAPSGGDRDGRADAEAGPAAAGLDSVTDAVLGGAADAQFELDLRWAAARLAALRPSAVLFTDLGIEAWSTALALRRSAPLQAALPGGPWLPRVGGAAQIDVVYTTRFHAMPYHGSVPRHVEVMSGSGFAPFVPAMPRAVSRSYVRRRIFGAAVAAGMLSGAADHTGRGAAAGPQGSGSPAAEPATDERETAAPGLFLLFVPHTQPKLSSPSLLGLLRALAARPRGLALLLDGTGAGWSPVTAARLRGVAASPLLAAAERRVLAGASNRVGFLPRLTAQAYAAVLAAADAVWDTWPYSGVSTTVEAAAAGVPIFDAASTLGASPSLCAAHHAREQEAPLADVAALRTVHGCELYRAAVNGSLFDPELPATGLVASLLRRLG